MKTEEKIIVIWKDAENDLCEREFNNLAPAMDWAKTLALFVTIKGADYELVGKFGVDSIVEGVLPDGTDYTWKKRRR
jgi:hypothetical protein